MSAAIQDKSGGAGRAGNVLVAQLSPDITVG